MHVLFRILSNVSSIFLLNEEATNIRNPTLNLSYILFYTELLYVKIETGIRKRFNTRSIAVSGIYYKGKKVWVKIDYN